MVLSKSPADVLAELAELRERVGEIPALRARIADLEAGLNIEAPTTTEDSLIPIPEKGTPISLNQCRKRYGVSPQTVANWRDLEPPLVATIRRGNGARSRCLVDERDVVLVLLDRGKRPGRGLGRKALEKLGLAS